MKKSRFFKISIFALIAALLIVAVLPLTVMAGPGGKKEHFSSCSCGLWKRGYDYIYFEKRVYNHLHYQKRQSVGWLR